MEKFLLRLLINGVALYAAVALLNGHGVSPQSTNWLSFVWLALIFGLINAFVRPVLRLLTCPLIILTLGLGTLLINTLLFYLAGVVGTNFGVGFRVDGFLPALYGALITSAISIVLSLFFKEELKK